MGDYREAREWMAVAVPTLHEAVNLLTRALVRPSAEPDDVKVCARYLWDAIRNVSEAEENLLRAKFMIEKMIASEGEVQ